jgi:hypothetical protein
MVDRRQFPFGNSVSRSPALHSASYSAMIVHGLGGKEPMSLRRSCSWISTDTVTVTSRAVFQTTR